MFKHKNPFRNTVFGLIGKELREIRVYKTHR